MECPNCKSKKLRELKPIKGQHFAECKSCSYQFPIKKRGKKK